MTDPHCCTPCTDSPITDTGYHKTNQQVNSFRQLSVVYCLSAACGWPAYIYMGYPKV